MNLGYFSYPLPANEPVLQYAPGSNERTALEDALKRLESSVVDIPMQIGSQLVTTPNKVAVRQPHKKAHILGNLNEGNATHIKMAIDAALGAKADWENTTWENRAHIFLKAADLIAGKYRYIINASTMLGQSKNAYQAEIDAACELIDFLKFNVHYLSEIYKQQPIDAPGIHNRLEWRPLEGFVLAITPFNFTAIAANLPAVAAMCGNTVVWKPAYTQAFSAHFIMQIFKEAGLPDGVINLVFADGPVLGEVSFTHRSLAGIHFTGSSAVFNHIWQSIGKNIGKYISYPRIVGETGGKDFVVAHASANPDIVATALLRGAFEYQGQKCSAASRAYIPDNISDAVKKKLTGDLATLKIGPVQDFGNFVNAVIDEKAFDSIEKYIRNAEKDTDASIIAGGECNKSEGYFIQPTVIETTNPKYITMQEEIFGPVLTIYIYPADEFEQTLELVNTTSPYALTGAVIATDRYAIQLATDRLRQAAGNFYINDKPTGAVVGQQPFGGARASGTNDKAGSMLNLYRWLSARTIKETFVPPTDYRYPFLANK